MPQTRQVQRAVLFFLVVFGSIATSAAENRNPKSVTFSLSGVSYKFELPKGYCTLMGKDKEMAATLASLDTRNMTHFTIAPCEELGHDADFTKWGILKTPRASIGKHIETREEFVRDFKQQIKTDYFRAALVDATKLANKTYEEVFGTNVKLDMHLEPVDVDEYAGYMAGTGSVSFGDKKFLAAVVGAMTVVKRNVFFYYKYAEYHNLADILELLKPAKTEIGRFVKDNSK